MAGCRRSSICHAEVVNNPLISGVNHIGFTVTDLDAAIAFLTECAESELLSREGRPPEMARRLTGVADADVEIAFVAGAGLLIELLRYHAPELTDVPVPTPAHPGAMHLALDVSNISAFVRRAASHGLNLRGEVLTIPAGPNKGGKVAYASHPSGLSLELLET